MKILSIILMTIAVMSAHAELFKWKDAEGNIIYSDQPPPGKEKSEAKVEKETLPQIIAVPAEQPTSISSSSSPKEKISYNKVKSLVITEPKHDEALRENSGNVSINVRVDPINFAENGSILAIYMDGKEVAKGPETSVQLLNVDRGTHTLKVELINSAGNVILATRPTVFHLQRYHN